MAKIFSCVSFSQQFLYTCKTAKKKGTPQAYTYKYAYKKCKSKNIIRKKKENKTKSKQILNKYTSDFFSL